MSKNKTKRVYVVINSDNRLEIEAICVSEESLKKYLNEERLVPTIERVKTFADEEYEISLHIPKMKYEVLYADIDIARTKSATYPKVWVGYGDPYEGVYFFETKDEAEKWAAKIDIEDCPQS